MSVAPQSAAIAAPYGPPSPRAVKRACTEHSSLCSCTVVRLADSATDSFAASTRMRSSRSSAQRGARSGCMASWAFSVHSIDRMRG